MLRNFIKSMKTTDNNSIIKSVIEGYDLIFEEADYTTDSYGNKIYSVDLNSDSFIHFTTIKRANEIKKTGKLLMNPPYEKFGTDTVDAVSATMGVFVPGVQLSHITRKNESDIVVAIIFKTDTMPGSYGYIEEVKWDRDVNIKEMKVVPTKTAINMLNNNNSPYANGIEDYMISYK